MSWLNRSITTSLNLQNEQKHEQQVDYNNSPQSIRGMKEDLSDISKTLTRQIWSLTSFLSVNEESEPFDLDPYDLEAVAGMRRDFAEIGGRFRSEISKLASEFLQVDSDDDEDYDSSDGNGDGDGAVGVTDDVVAFASDIAMHPETWLGFPLPEVEEDDDEDFDLSDAQQEHACAVQRLAPRLSALRIKLCPNYMSESSFWKTYFVLLHPRLRRDAAELLSTPSIVKARALLTSELKSDCKSKSLPIEVSAVETVKHPIKSDGVQIVDKSVIQEDSHEVKDDWLKGESPKKVTNIVTIPIENNEDVSFSDLEDDDDDDGNIPIHYKNGTHPSDSSTKDSRGSVQLKRSSIDSGKDSDSLGQVRVRNSKTEGSNDWLDLDIDVA